jgi:hypothetical protein
MHTGIHVLMDDEPGIAHNKVLVLDGWTSSMPR